MREALAEARKAFEQGQVPVGAILVREGKPLGRGHNGRLSGSDPLAHAELVALRRAARRLGDWRIPGSTLYVTLEPCPMCAGALVSARIERLVFGAASRRDGAAGTVLNLADYPGLSHQVRVYGGLEAEECGRLLQEFFDAQRGEVAESG